MNPILPGFYPDPSIVRVVDDYYLVTSSFEYFPGVPIFHSKNLADWQQIGHVLTRESQLPLKGAKSSKGIFAPTLREHQGTFYLITTNMSVGQSFYVTSRDPKGPWSDPIWIAENSFSMDPSLMFDDDGTVYYTRHGGGERGGVYQAEIDIETGELSAEPRLIWSGTGGVWPEGPHLHKRNGIYYLLIAEGGTGYAHEVTVARSSSPWGPFESCPRNPIFTHKNNRKHPVQATGHADITDDQLGQSWMVFLGIRAWDETHHHLGRETFLTPVTWDSEAWPVVNENEYVDLELNTQNLPAPRASGGNPAVPAKTLRDDFDDEELPLHYNFLRNPSRDSWSLRARPGWLRLWAGPGMLDDEGETTFVGRRQQHHRVTVSAKLEFSPAAEGEQAGLVVRADEKNHFELCVTKTGVKRSVILSSRLKGDRRRVGQVEVPDGGLILTVQAYPDRYEFFVAPEGAPRKSLGIVPSVPLSSEQTGGFTGVYFGMYSAGAALPATAPADFDWFEYQPALLRQ
jgi:alpha-N-arabinofuranosidase